MEDASVRNPREKAGFLSLLTFSWINDILKLGSKQPLEEKHLFPVDTSNQAERLVADLEREWLAEERVSEQNRTKPRLWRAMMRVISYREYITVAFLRCFYGITLNVLPLFIWFFLKSISTASDVSYKTTLPFVVCIQCLVAAVRSACEAQALFRVEMIAVRLKVAMIGLVYKQASNVSLSFQKPTCTTEEKMFHSWGGGETPYNGLNVEAPPERGTLCRLEVYKRVRISRVDV